MTGLSAFAPNSSSGRPVKILCRRQKNPPRRRPRPPPFIHRPRRRNDRCGGRRPAPLGQCRARKRPEARRLCPHPSRLRYRKGQARRGTENAEVSQRVVVWKFFSGFLTPLDRYFAGTQNFYGSTPHDPMAYNMDGGPQKFTYGMRRKIS